MPPEPLMCVFQRSVVMPQFYFDVREGQLFVEDEDGLEFPDLGTAEQEAIQAAASIGKERLPRGTPVPPRSRCATSVANVS
jgi:hypothetical protein